VWQGTGPGSNMARIDQDLEPTLDSSIASEPADSPQAALRARKLIEQRKIGSGGTGVVYEALDTRLSREVAKKTLSEKNAGQPAHFLKFIQEAEITAQLDHPNIVSIHDLDIDAQGRFYFTMHLVRGRSLHLEVKSAGSKRIAPRILHRNLSLFVRLCDAVAFAHGRGVTHADIKPANILVGDYGQIFLTDWGNAHISEMPGAPRISLATNRQGLIMPGTPGFCAPEQATAKGPIGPWTDIFGLGAVLYFLVTGKAPFAARTVEERMVRAQACDYTPVEKLVSSTLVKPLTHLIDKAMARKPADRFGSVVELQTELESLLRGGAGLPQRHVGRGDIIVREGDLGHEAFIIESGGCVVTRERGGREETLRRMKTGDVFGETAVLTGGRRTATVRATKATTLRVVTRNVLENQMGLDSWMGALVLTLAQRFKEADARLAATESASPVNSRQESPPEPQQPDE